MRFNDEVSPGYKLVKVIRAECSCSSGLIGGVYKHPTKKGLCQVVTIRGSFESILEFHFDNPRQDDHAPPALEFKDA